MMSAVHHGDDHRSNSSYAKSPPTSSNAESHLLRKYRGKFLTGWNTRRAKSRTRMNGHAKQKKLPPTSSTSTRAPRKCTQLKVVARFFGAIAGPKKPCPIINTLSNSNGAW